MMMMMMQLMSYGMYAAAAAPHQISRLLRLRRVWNNYSRLTDKLTLDVAAAGRAHYCSRSIILSRIHRGSIAPGRRPHIVEMG